MKNPQTRAEMIGKYSCLAMCYLYCVGIEPKSDGEMIKYISAAMDKGLLDAECTVLSAANLLRHFTGKEYLVTKEKITDIENIKEPTPVRYTNNGYGHWVVVQNGKIVFNSLAHSVCVEKGKPTEARVIKLK